MRPLSGRNGVTSDNLADFLEGEARIARGLDRLGIPEADQEVGPPSSPIEEKLVDPGVIEAGHGPAVEPEQARGDQQVAALQAAVADGGFLREIIVPGEPG